jgi:hypothetical protein
MKTVNEMKAFAEGYRNALLGTDMSHTDEWVQWGGYDLNIFGQKWGIRIEGDQSLSVDAYPMGWQDTLPEPIYTFDMKGETA